MIVYKKTDEWYIEWQRVTTSGTTSDSERPFRPIFLFFQIREESTTKHPKENSLNLEEDLWRRPIELRAETSTQKEILTVRSRNCRSNCSQIFTKIVFLKILQYSPFNRFAGFKTCNFLKKFQVFLKPAKHRCFPLNIAKFLKTAFSIEHLWWLLLELRHFLVCDV